MLSGKSAATPCHPTPLAAAKCLDWSEKRQKRHGMGFAIEVDKHNLNGSSSHALNRSKDQP